MAQQKPLPKPVPKKLLPHDTPYTFFADAAGNPFRPASKKFQLVNAWWLADAAFLAYRTKAEITRALAAAGLALVAFESGKSTQCYVARGKGFAIVVFRGTDIRSYEDVIADLKFLPVPWGSGGMAHQGFRDALEEVWAPLKKMLDGLRVPLFFTGHSLGAALATLAADRYERAQAVYTYGSPRVGDADFAADYRLRTYRFVNNNDVVPKLPPKGGVFHHVGLLKYIDADGHIDDDPSLWERLKDGFRGLADALFDGLGQLRSAKLKLLAPDALADHAPVYYAIKIWNNYVRDRA